METDKTGYDAEGISVYAYEIADAMQAEADKRKPKVLPEVLFEPDWSIAPDGFNWWAVDSFGSYWYARKITWNGDEWDYEKGLFNGGSPTIEAPSFNYQGDWKNSLRKRP